MVSISPFSVSVGSSSASVEGMLALLSEDDGQLKMLASTRLNDLVAEHWMEIVNALPEMYAIFESRFIIICVQTLTSGHNDSLSALYHSEALHERASFPEKELVD